MQTAACPSPPPNVLPNEQVVYHAAAALRCHPELCFLDEVIEFVGVNDSSSGGAAGAGCGAGLGGGPAGPGEMNGVVVCPGDEAAGVAAAGGRQGQGGGAGLGEGPLGPREGDAWGVSLGVRVGPGGRGRGRGRAAPRGGGGYRKDHGLQEGPADSGEWDGGRLGRGERAWGNSEVGVFWGREIWGQKWPPAVHFPYLLALQRNPHLCPLYPLLYFLRPLLS